MAFHESLIFIRQIEADQKVKYQSSCHSGLDPESRFVYTPWDRGSKAAMTD